MTSKVVSLFFHVSIFGQVNRIVLISSILIETMYVRGKVYIDQVYMTLAIDAVLIATLTFATFSH